MPANSITPSDLKTILHSKRANIYYLEKCRIQVNGGRVEYVTQEGKESFYWNIPIANTTAVMLGMGTSVTQMAMREFARAGVMVGFVARMARHSIPRMKWILMSPGYARRVNIARRNIYRTGSPSGLMKKSACRRQNTFSLFDYNKLKNSGQGCGCSAKWPFSQIKML